MYGKLIQGQGPYARELRKIEADIKDVQKRVNEKMGNGKLR
jgi:26S proteasome regulatory subunit T1